MIIVAEVPASLGFLAFAVVAAWSGPSAFAATPPPPRHPPFFGFDEPLLRAFREKYGEDARAVKPDDPRWLDLTSKEDRLIAAGELARPRRDRLSPEQYRTRAARWYAMGADGVHLFNTYARDGIRAAAGLPPEK